MLMKKNCKTCIFLNVLGFDENVFLIIQKCGGGIQLSEKMLMIASNRWDWYCIILPLRFLALCVYKVLSLTIHQFFFFVCFFNKLLFILNVSTFLFQSSDWHFLAFFFTHMWKEVCLLQIKKMDIIHFTTDNTDKKYCLQTNICTTNAR